MGKTRKNAGRPSTSVEGKAAAKKKREQKKKRDLRMSGGPGRMSEGSSTGPERITTLSSTTLASVVDLGLS